MRRVPLNFKDFIPLLIALLFMIAIAYIVVVLKTNKHEKIHCKCPQDYSLYSSDM